MEKERSYSLLQKEQISLRIQTKVCPTCDEHFDNDEHTVCPVDKTLLCPVGKDSLIGRQVSNFEIISRIGSGSSSNVYLAKATEGGLTSDSGLLKEDTVAIKVLDANLLSDPTALKRFQREAQLVRSLNHPQIAAVLDFGVLSDGRPYLILEYVKGETLKEILEKTKKLAPADSISVFGDIIDAVEAAHNSGIFHRDIKPSNIIIDTKGRAKVLDFGIAKVIGIEDATSVTLTGASVGTPAYMSPEQCLGKEQDARSDIYSIGCVMYECLSGSKVFPAENAFSCMRQHSFYEPTELSKLAPGVPAPIATTVMRCLEKDADDRFQTLAEMRQALLGDVTTYAIRRKSNSASSNSIGKSTKRTTKLALYLIPILLTVFAAIILKVGYQKPATSPAIVDPPTLPVAGFLRQVVPPPNPMTPEQYDQLLSNFHDFKFDGLWTKARNVTFDPTEQAVGQIAPNGTFTEAHAIDLPVFAGVRDTDSTEASWFLLARDGLVQYDPKTKMSVSVPLPKEMPERLFCTGITCDTKRNRILVTSEHFAKDSNLVEYTVLLAYDPKTSNWSEVAKIKNLALYGLGYSPSDDAIYTLGFAATEAGGLHSGSICKLTADGDILEMMLPSADFNALMTSQPPDTQLAVYDRFLIVTFEGHQILIFDRYDGQFYSNPQHRSRRP